MTRPALARTNSAASGLRFCGIMDEPVVNLSESSPGRPAATSTARSPRQIATGAPRRSPPRQASPARSRDPTRHRASWQPADQTASAFAGIARSSGNEVPASAAGSERRLVEPAARISKPTAVARRHLHVGQEMMAEGHRLSGLQMGKAGHDGRRIGQRLARRARADRRRVLDRCVDRVADPEPEIGCDLIVARTRGVQPPGPAQSARPAAPRRSCGCLRARA